MKMMLPTLVTHVTLLVLNVTDHTNPTVSDVKNQDIYKTTTVLSHLVLPDLTQKTLVTLVNHVTLLVPNVTVEETVVVISVMKDPTYTTTLVLLLAHKVTSLTPKPEPVTHATEIVVLVTVPIWTNVLLVAETLSYTELFVLNHVQPELGLTPPPTLVTHVTKHVPPVLMEPPNLVLLVLLQDIYISTPPTIPLENVETHVQMDIPEMTISELVNHVTLLV
jgi:hypothetical protein